MVPVSLIPCHCLGTPALAAGREPLSPASRLWPPDHRDRERAKHGCLGLPGLIEHRALIRLGAFSDQVTGNVDLYRSPFQHWTWLVRSRPRPCTSSRTLRSAARAGSTSAHRVPCGNSGTGQSQCGGSQGMCSTPGARWPPHSLLGAGLGMMRLGPSLGLGAPSASGRGACHLVSLALHLRQLLPAACHAAELLLHLGVGFHTSWKTTGAGSSQGALPQTPGEMLGVGEQLEQAPSHPRPRLEPGLCIRTPMWPFGACSPACTHGAPTSKGLAPRVWDSAGSDWGAVPARQEAVSEREPAQPDRSKWGSDFWTV